MKTALTTFALAIGLLTLEPALAQPEIEWERRYGTEHTDDFVDAIATFDYGFVLYGVTAVRRAGQSAQFLLHLIKINNEGEVLWDRTFVDVGDMPVKLLERPNRNLVALGKGGRNGHQIFLLQTTPEGDSVSCSFFGSDLETFWPADMVVKPDGNFVACGKQKFTREDGYNMFLLNMPSRGRENWRCLIPIDEYQYPVSLIQLRQGGYSIGGTSGEGWPGENTHMWLYNTDADQDTVGYFQEEYDIRGDDFLVSHLERPDGGFSLAGTADWLSNGEMAMIFADEFGENPQSFTYGMERASERALGMIQAADGGYVIAGETAGFGGADADGYLVRTDSAGDQLWTSRVSGRATYNEEMHTIIPTPEGGYMVFGRYGDPDRDWDFWAIRYAPDLLNVGSRGRDKVELPEIEVATFPNPLNNFGHVSFDLPAGGLIRAVLLNQMGSEVMVLAGGQFTPGRHRLFLDGGLLPTGAYWLRIEGSVYNAVNRSIIVLK